MPGYKSVKLQTFIHNMLKVVSWFPLKFCGLTIKQNVAETLPNVLSQLFLLARDHETLRGIYGIKYPNKAWLYSVRLVSNFRSNLPFGRNEAIIAASCGNLLS